MATTLSGPADLDDDEREAVEALLYRLADDEFVVGERYTDWQVRAPTLESDLALSNIAQDEYGHARLWYDLLQDFGYDEPDLIWERDPADFTHSTLTELAFEEGDWADAIVRSYLYDTAEDVRLRALEDSAYPRIRDRIEKIQREEDYHVEHAENWIERLAGEEGAHARLQDAVDRLFPHALTLFESVGEVEEEIDALNLRTSTLAEMRDEWLDVVVPRLASLDLSVPASSDEEVDALVPEATGRNREHTDDWFDLYDEFTHTYRELGRSAATTLMKDPDDVE